MSYETALRTPGLLTLHERYDELSGKLFNDIACTPKMQLLQVLILSLRDRGTT